MYFAGIDGGGTKSRLIAVDEEGNYYGPYIGGSTNANSNPAASVQGNIKSLLFSFLDEQGKGLEDLKGVCIGSAGVDLPQHVIQYTGLVKGIGLECPVKVVNDVEIVLESEAKGEPGVVIIAGTGSIALGKDASGKTARIGGWGHMIGDEGSGYWIGREAICRSLKSYDGREKPTMLAKMLIDTCGLSEVTDILELVYAPNSNKSMIAGFSRLVDTAAAAGDEVAMEILSDAANDIFMMADAAVRSLDLSGSFPVILSGGTIQGSDIYLKLVKERLYVLTDRVECTSQEPYMGALYLAQQM